MSAQSETDQSKFATYKHPELLLNWMTQVDWISSFDVGVMIVNIEMKSL